MFASLMPAGGVAASPPGGVSPSLPLPEALLSGVTGVCWLAGATVLRHSGMLFHVEHCYLFLGHPM